MEDTAVLSLTAGTVRTEVGSEVVGTALWLAGLEPDLEPGRPLGAGPVVGHQDGPLAGHGVGGGGKVGLPALGGEAGVGQGRAGVGLRHDLQTVVVTAALQLHLHRGHHHLRPVQRLHLEVAGDVGEVGGQWVAVGHNLYSTVCYCFKASPMNDDIMVSVL